MARDLSCGISAKPAYKTKRDCEKSHPDVQAVRCDHCRWWHPKRKKGRRHR